MTEKKWYDKAFEELDDKKSFNSLSWTENKQTENEKLWKEDKKKTMGYSFKGTVNPETGETIWDDMCDCFQEGNRMDRKQKINKYAKELIELDARMKADDEKFDFLVDVLTELGVEVDIVNGNIQIDVL